MAKQIITTYDSLKGFKENAFRSYHNCSFFEHNVNGTIDIGIGEYNGNIVREKIITDGKISLHRKNPYHPKVIWQNILVTLKNGISISIDISDATFMVDVIRFGEKKENEIHVVEDDKDRLQTILDFLYHQQQLPQLNSISFKTPSILVLESTINGEPKQETLDFGTGYSKTKNRRKR